MRPRWINMDENLIRTHTPIFLCLSHSFSWYLILLLVSIARLLVLLQFHHCFKWLPWLKWQAGKDDTGLATGWRWMDVTNEEKWPKVTCEKQIDIWSRLCLLTTEDKDKEKLKLFTCFTILTIRWRLSALPPILFTFNCACTYSILVLFFMIRLVLRGAWKTQPTPLCPSMDRMDTTSKLTANRPKLITKKMEICFFFFLLLNTWQLFERMLSSHQSLLCGINFRTKISVECNKLAGRHEGRRNGRFPFEMMLRM